MAWVKLHTVACPRCQGCLAWDSTREAHCLLCGHRVFGGWGPPPVAPGPVTQGEKISAGLRAKYYRRKNPIHFALLIVGSVCLP